MHPSIMDVFGHGLLSDKEIAGGRVLEVGSYDVNGSVRPVIESHRPALYIGVDTFPGPRVDCIVEAGDLLKTFGPDAFDIVVSTEMLEHAAEWQRCVVNMAAVVVEGGLLVITTRGPGFPYHAFPDDFWRFTPIVMRRILEAVGFEVLLCSPDPDPLSPGVIVKATKPEGWKIPDELALFDPAVQPDAVQGRPDANAMEWLRPDRQWESYCGVECQQFRTDMDRYKEVIDELCPPFIVEVGRADGGTALYLADTLNRIRPDGWVVSIDVAGPMLYHERIKYMQGSSTHPTVLHEVRKLAAERRGMILLDGDHRSAQVAQELTAYADLADYLIVEDTIIRHLPGLSDGPHLALDVWLPDHSEFVADPDPVLTQHPGGWLRRV